MRIFVTGATGTIGGAVAATLAAAGHEVLGLVRSEERGRVAASHEVLPVVGDLADPASFAAAAAECQVLVHCAAEASERFHELDRRTVAALIDAARRPELPRLLVYTSGVWLYGDTGDAVADETTPLRPPALVAPRAETEQVVLGANRDRVRTLVLRPGCVYGGRGGLTASWFESAGRGGAARVVGSGEGTWTMVHVADLARAYLLAVESPWGGEVFNVTDRSRARVRECAAAASRVAGGGGRVESVPVAEATGRLGPVAECLALSQHVDSSKAVRLLGWQPRHGGFVDGVARYHAAWKSGQGR